MNKNQIIMASIGGVGVVIALVVGYLAWDGLSVKGEKLEELEMKKSQVQKINAGPVSPEQAAVEAIESNRKHLSSWCNEALALASRGDVLVNPYMTPDALKQRMVGDARKLADLPGAAQGGKFVKEGFDFGFKGIVAGSEMPEREKIEILQRQWSDVKMFVETLAESGAVELAEVTVGDVKLPQPQEAKKPAKGAKGKGAKKVERPPLATAQGYVLKFMARPFAVVKAINALTGCERFVVIDDASYVRADDALAVTVGGKEKAEATSGRRRRRGRSSEEEKPEGEGVNRKGLVVDPATDVPFTVTLKLTVYDFGTRKGPAPVETEEEAKEVEE